METSGIASLAIILAAVVIGGFLYVVSVGRESARARDKMRTLLFEGARDHERNRWQHWAWERAKSRDFRSSGDDLEREQNLLIDRLRQIDDAEKAGNPVPPELPDYPP